MSLEDIERRLTRLEDLEAIRRLKHQYCDYCDDHYNPEALASLWIEGGVWDAGPSFGRYVGREAIAGFFREVAKAVQFAAHTVMNEKIDVAACGTRAKGKWWCIMPSTFLEEGRAVDRWLFAEYTEEYVKVDGRWLFESLRSAIHRNAPHLQGWARYADTRAS